MWRYGHWQSVYIDDRLPQRGGGYVYARCSDPKEFWVALLEKVWGARKKELFNAKSRKAGLNSQLLA